LIQVFSLRQQPLGWPLFLSGPDRVFLLHPALFDEEPPEQELDLSVEAPQVVVCPTLQSLMDSWIKPQEKWFAIGHEAAR
jgi:hypothetical protein